MPSSTDEPESTSRRNSILGLLLVVVVLVMVIAVLFGSFSLFGIFQAPRSPSPRFELVFSGVGIDATRNASWAVDSVEGGPYPYMGFSIRLSLNGGTMNWVPLGPSDTVQSVVVGMVTLRMVWHDADGNGLVSKGDAFSVTGDKAPLPSAGTFEFVLKWHESWLSHAYWSTS